MFASWNLHVKPVNTPMILPYPYVTFSRSEAFRDGRTYMGNNITPKCSLESVGKTI